MIKNSFAYSCFLILQSFYDASFLKIIIYKLGSAIFCLWSSSFTRKIFCKDFGLSNALNESIVGKLFLRIKPLALGLYISRSRIISTLNMFAENAIYLSLRVYGVIIGTASILIFALRFVFSSDFSLPISIAMVVLSAVLIMVNRSAAALLNSSFFCRLICDFFGVSYDPKTIPATSLLSLSAVGFSLGIISFLIGPLYSALMIVGLMGFILTMYKTQTAIFAAAFLLPIFPTKIMLGLAALTVLSYFTKLIITGSAKFTLSLLDLFVALFGILLIYSVFISFIPSNSAVVVASYVLFILFYFATKNTIKTQQQLYTIASILIFSGFIVAALGVYQRITGNNITMESSWIDTTMFDGNDQRIYSTLENPNVLGEYLLFVIPMAFGGLYYYKSYLNKFISLCILAVMCVCMIFTLSRGAWLGLIVGMGIFALIRDRRLVVLGLIALLFAPAVMPEEILRRFTSIGNMNDSSTLYRVNIWLASTKLLADFWPIGIGLGTSIFILVYQKYAFSASYAHHSHNLYLQILIDIGIWGFLLFASYIFIFYKGMVLKLSEASNFIKTFSVTLCAGMTGFLVQGMADNSWYNYRIVMYFWLIMALSGVIAGLKERTE